jgi:hypothetical protein
MAGWLVVGLFNYVLSVPRLYSVDNRMTSEWWIGNDLVGSGRGLILRYYPGIRLEGLRKFTKLLGQDSRSPESTFEPRTSRIRSRSVNHSTTTFDTKWQERSLSDHTHNNFFARIQTVTSKLLPGIPYSRVRMDLRSFRSCCALQHNVHEEQGNKIWRCHWAVHECPCLYSACEVACISGEWGLPA